MRYRWNPFRKDEYRAEVRTGAAWEFHRTLPGYAPTPLRLLNAFGSEIHVKDESTRFGLNAFKALGASWAMRGMRAETYSAATDGNHGRAVAWMARLQGARSVILIPGHAKAERVEAIRREGADVRMVNGTYDDAVRECARLSESNGWQVVSDTGYPGYLEIPERVMEGYGTLFDEFEQQRRAMGLDLPDMAVIQAGVGGLLCAAIRHFSGQPVTIVAVEPEEADCLFASISSEDGRPATSTGRQESVMACLNCGEVSLAAWPTIRAGCDLFVTIEDAVAMEAMELGKGVEWGESGVAGMAGLLAMKRMGLKIGDRVMVVNSEGPISTR